MEIQNKQTLGAVFNALSSGERLKALELFGQGKELAEIAKLIGMSRSGFQKIVDAFRELGLIENVGHRSYYRLSFKGEKILSLLKDFEKKLEHIEIEYEKLHLRETVLKSPLTVGDLEELVKELRLKKLKE